MQDWFFFGVCMPGSGWTGGVLSPAVTAGPYYSSLLPVVFRAFETQMTRLEAEFVRREAPPSYGQLIAQGLIPPVEDFPVYSASQVSCHEYQYGVPQGPGFFPTGSPRVPKT